MSAELDPSVKEEIKKAVSESMVIKKDDDDQKFTIPEYNKHIENCSSSDCPICKPMNDKILGEKINDTANRIDNILEKKKFSEINKDKYNSCVKQKTMQCEKKYATAGRLAKIRLGIGKRIAGSKSI